MRSGYAFELPEKQDGEGEGKGEAEAKAQGPAGRPASGTLDTPEAYDAGEGANVPPRPVYRFIKRAFDVLFSAVVIVVLFIPGLILAAFVTRDTSGSPIYTQERVGKGGKPFRILKFRSMVADADNVEKYLDEDQLRQWHEERKVDNDPRITPLGRVLRTTSIDEFPQFINVLVGHMSVVGPRAITFEELGQFAPSQQNVLLSMRPGVTGAWQTGERNECTFESGHRQEVEVGYVMNASVGLDAKYFFKTFGAMFNKTGR